MSAFERLLQDRPPEFAFEIAADGIAMSRTRPPMSVQHVPLPAGAIVPSPVKENVVSYEAFTEAVTKLVPAGKSNGRRACTLILPDNSMRLSVIEFDSLPQKEEERVSLIKFRLRKTLPFDLDEAAFSYFVQRGNKVITAVSPVEIIARYEAPFRAAGFHPGMVTCSSLAMMELLPATGSYMVAHLSPGALTVLTIEDGVLTLVRSIEMTAQNDDLIGEVSTDLYPTLVYIEDQTGKRPEKLIVAGFGEDSASAATRLAVELDVAVEVLSDRHAGLSGYVRSLAAPGKTVPAKKVAA